MENNTCCEFRGDILIKVLPPVLFLEFALGVLGNGLALWIFCFHLKPWKSSTVFLFNLALTDFLLHMVLPFRASYYLSGMDWKFGETFCHVSLFMLALNRSGSILFLMVVALDRYMRVVHPHHPLNSMTVFKAMCGAVGLWVLTFSMTAHLLTDLMPHKSKSCESFNICKSFSGSLNWHKSMFVFSFYLPLSVTLFCTVCIIVKLRGKQLGQHAKIRKALWFITMVVVLFIICFLPSNVTQLLIWVRAKNFEACEDMEDLNTAFYITISLTYLNSTLDPVIYYFSSPAFQRIYRKAVGLRQVKKTEDTGENKTRESGSQTLSQL